MAEAGNRHTAKQKRATRRARRSASALALWLLGWLAAAWLPPHTLAADPAQGAHQGNPVSSVFFISKSENRNQVHYSVAVDEQCRPRGPRPLKGYWRDFEVGPNATSPLLDREQSAYGLTEPRWVRSVDHGGQIRIGLRGFPDRPLTVQTFQTAAGCRARALTTIQRSEAVLRSIYVEIGFLFSIDYVLVRGFRVQDNRPVQEKVND